MTGKFLANALPAALAVLIVTEAAAAGDETLKTNPFTGMWEGIDPLDGGLTQRSIACEGSKCSVLGADQRWTSCGSGQGKLVGSGTVDGKVLSVPGFTLECAGGRSLSVDTTFTYDPRNGTLTERTANPNIPEIVFHRMSVPPS